MTDRAALIVAVAAAWDDPLPVLVYADYAEEHGLDDPDLLRWYARVVMPAVAGVEPRQPRSTPAVVDRARQALRPHPQGDVLNRLAAVAFCRAPRVWEQIPVGLPREAVAAARLSALGLVPDADRKALVRRLRLDVAHGRVHYRDAGGYALADRVLDAAGPAALNAAVHLAAPPERRAEFHGYQAALLLRLATLPPLRPADRPVVSHDSAPGSGPPGFSRRVTVLGRAYQVRLVCAPGTDRTFHPEEMVVTPVYANRPRLVVDFGYPVWHFAGGRPLYPSQADTVRVIEDGLAAGWDPAADHDVRLEGRAYLPPADETTFG